MIGLGLVIAAAIVFAIVCVDAAGTFWAPLIGCLVFVFACCLDLGVRTR